MVPGRRRRLVGLRSQDRACSYCRRSHCSWVSVLRNSRPVKPGHYVPMLSSHWRRPCVGPLAAMLVLSTVDPRFDWILVATAAMLTAIGTTTLHSLSLMRGADGAFYQAIAIRHGFFVCAGFLALIAGTVLSRQLDQIRRYPFTLLGIALMLTVATVIFGQTVNGARLWLAVGPVQFQPSEVARLLLAGFVAALPLRSPSPGRRAVAGRVARSPACAVPAAASRARFSPRWRCWSSKMTWEWRRLLSLERTRWSRAS